LKNGISAASGIIIDADEGLRTNLILGASRVSGSSERELVKALKLRTIRADSAVLQGRNLAAADLIAIELKISAFRRIFESALW
jgi:hypothetical protein